VFADGRLRESVKTLCSTFWRDKSMKGATDDRKHVFWFHLINPEHYLTLKNRQKVFFAKKNGKKARGYT